LKPSQMEMTVPSKTCIWKTNSNWYYKDDKDKTNGECDGTAPIK
jgi:hypothetical protein